MTKYEKLADKLRIMIVSGRYHPGGMIPWIVEEKETT
ncbi:MAG: GntR family transcriptional regulator [Clostridiales bacterium]|nr:GntR family transcriptional regulator [Clostridiales bacterium]